MRTNSRAMAMGGVFAALAVVIMNLGGLIPVATYVCPVLCMLLLCFVNMSCGHRIAWAWYGAVSVLSLLLSPDKEAAAVFLFLGYYPIVKPRLDTGKLGWVWKLLIFNLSMVLLYSILIHLLGIAEVTGESGELAGVMLLVLLVLGNITFLVLDRLLGILELKMRRKRR